MNLFKKMMTGAAIGAMSLAVLGSTQANAAVSMTEIDATTQTMTLENAKGSNNPGGEGLVSYDAVKVTGRGDTATMTWNPKAKWDVVDLEPSTSSKSTTATVDLSALKTTKDMYIAVQDYANKDAVTVYKISADTTKYKATYRAGVFTLKNGKDEVKADDMPTLEFRTVNASAWTEYTDPEQLKIYEDQGATLYFRAKAVEFASDGDPVGIKVKGAADADPVMANVQAMTGHFATKEFKVKVAKKGNAPSITADYDKGMIRTKDGQAYRTEVASEDWIDATKAGIQLTAEQIAAGGVYEIKTKANDRKAESKIAVFKFAGVEAPVVDQDSKSKEYLGTIDGVLTAEVIKEAAKDKKNGKVVLKATGKDVLIFAGKQDGEDVVADTSKVLATVKAGNTKGTTIAQKKLTAGMDLFVAYASDKKNGVFRSAPVVLKTGGYDMAFVDNTETE